MSHCPAYEEYSDKPRPSVSWDTPCGSWVGIWGTDWGTQIGSEILKLDHNITYEVWQPDLRANTKHEHMFSNKVKHILYPAYRKKRIYGFKIIDVVFSDIMIEDLNNITNTQNVIIHLGDIYNSLKYFIPKISNHFIYINQFMSELNYPFDGFRLIKKNFFSLLFHYLDYKFVCKNIYKYKAIIVANNKRVDLLENTFNGTIYKLVNGIDYNFWSKNLNNIKKEDFGINKEDFIILMISRFTPNKQIHRFIQVLNNIEKKTAFNYKCLIIGHGEKAYEYTLKREANELISKDKIRFLPYQQKEDLRDLYNIADLFVSVSLSEGGPTTVKQAMACGVPVLMTNTGHTAEVLTAHNAGCIVKTHDYKGWEKKIEKILNGFKINTIPSELVKEYYNWGNVALKYIKFYKSIL